MLLAIAQIGEPVLREPTREVGREELLGSPFQGFIDDLVATMHDANGAGLAANQVHNSVRVCAIHVQDNPRYPYKPNIPLTVLVNPKLTPVGEDSFENFEGCLSVPNLRGVVRRHAQIRVQALDRHGNEIDEVVSGDHRRDLPARSRSPRRQAVRRPRRGSDDPVHLEGIPALPRRRFSRASRGYREALRELRPSRARSTARCSGCRRKPTARWLRARSSSPRTR